MNIDINTTMPFGKYKGILVSDLIPSNVLSDIEAKELLPYVQYFMWIKRETNHTLSDLLLNRIKEILLKAPKYIPDNSKHYNRFLNHYNDMGYMNDISFQDAYGDFGY